MGIRTDEITFEKMNVNINDLKICNKDNLPVTKEDIKKDIFDNTIEIKYGNETIATMLNDDVVRYKAMFSSDLGMDAKKLYDQLKEQGVSQEDIADETGYRLSEKLYAAERKYYEEEKKDYELLKAVNFWP